MLNLKAVSQFKRDFMECHIKPDTLLVYWISEETQTLYLERIGSHSELFR